MQSSCHRYQYGGSCCSGEYDSFLDWSVRPKPASTVITFLGDGLDSSAADEGLGDEADPDDQGAQAAPEVQDQGWSLADVIAAINDSRQHVEAKLASLEQVKATLTSLGQEQESMKATLAEVSRNGSAPQGDVGVAKVVGAFKTDEAVLADLVVAPDIRHILSSTDPIPKKRTAMLWKRAPGIGMLPKDLRWEDMDVRIDAQRLGIRDGRFIYSVVSVCLCKFEENTVICQRISFAAWDA